MLRRTYQLLRKTLIAVAGIALIILGIIFIPLPGPGLLIIIAGLFILSWEFTWAERHLDRTKHVVRKIRNKTRSKIKPDA